MKTPVFVTAYGPKTVVNTSTPGPSHVQQHMKDECDINNIVKKYNKTGVLDHLSKNSLTYGSLLGIPEYHDALNQIRDAQETFNALPASLRNRFNNDPAEFVDFAQNSDNIPEMRKLGLMDPERPAKPSPADNLIDAEASMEPPSGGVTEAP